eukprot:CAMPEP_0197659268 /NCGR_PEP_ID=MMETSP1338-20131121/46950_1 /TAXON_ID=43686 ORGANISM="Pelagodinium beii, Strain RCC1491" /NCGR_SAMPLE_ID=MMETSP1338 /ASSEMBLY_ACC=CAM_ASM_000754 /LENGTH=180 /DNA_ID=CAMNT_0043236113 /DNA_START=60 /DNA_END=602 /DNA_ORIENTATION=+
MPLSSKRSYKFIFACGLLHCIWQLQPAFTGSFSGTVLNPQNTPKRHASALALRYAPASVSAAWQNHFDAFGDQDVDKIMQDYDETSRVTVYNNADGSKVVYKGLAEVKHFFEELFDGLSDLSTLEAPVIDVDEMSGGGGQVFLVWKCPGCGFDTATDTFIFGPDKKIKFQNIVVTEYMVD